MTRPQKQVGYGFKRGSKEIVKFDNLPVQTPGANEILLKVEAAGLCLSDVHILHKPEKYLPDLFVMGHEISGSVYEAGANLKDNAKYALGKRFSVSASDACGMCLFCRKGHDNTCKQFPDSTKAYGINEDGGFQQFLLVKNLRTLIPIPENVAFEAAAVATDAILTPFHAIARTSDRLTPASKVLVVGLGGLGLNAVQILKQYGCHIVAIDVKEDVGAVALDLGADEFFTDMKDSPHKPESFDVTFDFCGFQETFDICQKFTKSQGRIIVVGMGRANLKIPNYHLARREIQVFFSISGTSSEQLKIMEWMSQGKIKPLYNVADMSELPKYLNELAKGGVKGRVVFIPPKL